MLDEAQQRKRDEQIAKHRGTNLKQHQYPLRLTDEQYERLRVMAGGGSMSAVIERGLETEWQYHQSVAKLMKKMPTFHSLEELETWRVEQFSGSSELLARYAKPVAIAAYTQELATANEAKQTLIATQNTVAYLIRNIGDNINQLARHANSGGTVSREALARLTKSVIRLTDAVEETYQR